MLFGYYRCDSPPDVGFTFGNSTQPLNMSFEYSQSVEEDGFCLSNLRGSDQLHDEWSIGQAWLEGKYVDFNSNNQQLSVALLKD